MKKSKCSQPKKVEEVKNPNLILAFSMVISFIIIVIALIAYANYKYPSKDKKIITITYPYSQNVSGAVKNLKSKGYPIGHWEEIKTFEICIPYQKTICKSTIKYWENRNLVTEKTEDDGSMLPLFFVSIVLLGLLISFCLTYSKSIRYKVDAWFDRN